LVRKKIWLCQLLEKNHVNPKDKAFQRKLKKEAEQGKLFLIMESKIFNASDVGQLNVFGLEDAVSLLYGKLAIGYMKNIKILTEAELQRY